MTRQQRRRRARARDYRVEPVPRQSPELHKLAQVFLGMAVTRAELDGRRGEERSPDELNQPEPEGGSEIE